MRPETVLAFDTSAAHCAAALLLPDGHCLVRQEEMSKGQAERLMPMLDELLAEAGSSWREISGIGVGTGPGNFTGVRIAVAAARGLSLGLAVPAIGVSVFESLAYGLPRPLVVVQDARRDEVYVQCFAETAGPARLLPRTEAAKWIGGLPVTGSAAGLFEGARILSPATPMVEAVARIAAGRLSAPQPRPAPFYLRGADAAPPADPPPVILDA